MTKSRTGKSRQAVVHPTACTAIATTGFQLKPLSRFVRQGFAVAALCSQIPGYAVGPVPGVRVPLTALPTGPSTQPVVGTIGGRSINAPREVSGSFNPYTVRTNVDGTVAATIDQTSNAGILQWNKFDIGANATVDVKQPSSTSVLLNKVADGDYNHSVVIEGKLNANGQVYIYNPNGIIFGKTSQVNVNSLVATTLKIDDSRFLAGILAPSDLPILAADTVAPGAVVVEGERDANGNRVQAHITADKGGRILLAGPSVTNNGLLVAPDGQVVLAAGGKVFISSPSDASMRGLVVEVANDNLAAANRGAATNDVLGQINVGHGNATLVGLAVNQNGIVSATTAVSANGSIYLHARDGATLNTATKIVTTSHGGALVLGDGSVTEVLPDLTDTTTSTGSNFNASQVDLSGNTIHLQGSASIIAPSGNVTARASSVATDGQGTSFAISNNSHIYLDAGASIDVSGTTNTQLAMESNVIQVQLRGNELADYPLQRNSALRGKTVSIDIRKGTQVANVQGWLGLVEKGIGEQTAAGGTISLLSDSDIVVNSKATLNVSGGRVTYKPGYIATTKLLSRGMAYDIGSASADRIYDGIIDPVAGPRNYQPGYVQGYSAGTITFNAPSMVLRGNLIGNVTAGALQRSVGTAPTGGQLVIGNKFDDRNDDSKLRFIGSAHLNSDSTAGIDVPAFDDSNPSAALQLPAEMLAGTDIPASTLAQNGFSSLQVYADKGAANLAKPLTLAAGGSLLLMARDAIDIAGDISAPGGTVTASSQSSVTVEKGVAINVSGRWTNDLASSGVALDAQGNPTTPIVLQGGSISLTAASTNLAEVTIGDGVSLDVSGGAWLNGLGKQTAGSAGSIIVGPSVSRFNDPAYQLLNLGNNVVMRGYGLASGGKLQVSAPNVLVGASSADPTVLGLVPSWFQQGGFTSFDVRAGGNLTVAAGAQIAPRTDNWVSRRTTSTIASGNMDDAFDIATLSLGSAAGSRKAANLSLRAGREDHSGQGVLEVKAGATIATDPGGSVSLSAGSLLNVNGTITAPGGSINLALTADPNGVLYYPDRSIWLGSSAVLDAGGSAASLWQDARGRTQGTLRDGGQISIGQSGYVVVNSGAYLNVSGTSAPMTFASGRSGVQTSTMASNGGSISIRAREGLLFDGTFGASSGNSSARGGSLSLVLDRENLLPAGYPTNQLDMVVAASDPNPGVPGNGVVPQGLHPGQALDAVAGQGFVSAAAINAGGFDSVRIKSAGVVDFDLMSGNVSLGARSGLTIDAPTIASRNAVAGSEVRLNAPYVSVGNSDWRYQSASQTATTGDAALKINAGTADLVGQSSLTGFGSAQFNVSGDIRLVGQTDIDLSQTPAVKPPAIHALGNFSVAGTMDFSSAQVYPTSLSEFTLDATGPSSAIAFRGNGNAASVPLAVAGTLTVSAQDITQNGVVRAPLGSIDFEAGNSLSYGSGSLTSVAGSPTVPLGLVTNGRSWLYDFGNGHTINLSDATASNYVALPEKGILSHGPVVNLNKGATLDLSGGGDIYAYEFTSGPGGSKDVLASTGTFAILPGFTGAVAPRDFQNGTSGLNAGDQVYLSGIAGLAAGFYTLLPAHYALLPGAYAISAISGTTNMSVTQNRQLPLGNWQVAGYLASLGGADSRWQGFQLTSASLIRQQSEFADYKGNAFLTTPVTLPNDGGRVAFDVTQSLLLDGRVNLTASGGRNGSADISAPEIAIVSDRTQGLPAGSSPGTLKLAVTDLSAMNADSLLIGGLRTLQSDGQHLTVGATKVEVANDASHPLSGADIILAATDRVQVDGGSVITAQKIPSRQAGDLLVQGSGTSADGALLRVSGGNLVATVRNAPARAKGTLDVQTGSTLKAAGSILTDATDSLSVKGDLAFGDGAAFGIGAPKVSLGSTAPAGVAGLRFDDLALAGMSKLSALALTSYSTMDLYGVVSLGSSSMKNLSLTANAIRACGSACDVTSDGRLRQATFIADTVRLAGAGGIAPATTVPTAGPNYAASSLTVNATNIEIGNNTLAVQGYANTSLNASAYVRGIGKTAELSSDADLTVKAGRIVANSGSDVKLSAAKQLTLTQFSPTPVTGPAGQFGGRLTFAGDTIVSDAIIQATAGKIAMQATGSGGINITGGEINAAGGAEVFGTTTAYAPAGSIELDGGSGNVTVGAGSILDVSTPGGAAGTLSVKATNGSNGTANLGGTIRGDSSDTTQTQGQFVLDVDTVGTSSQFSALNDKLNAAGFTGSRAVRVRNGDIVVDDKGVDTQGNKIDAIRAHQVILAADKGDVTVGGQINASGAKGGRIELYASQPYAAGSSGNVTLQGTAVLLANATTAATSAAGSTGDGGSVVIGTSAADGQAPGITGSRINLQSGYQIDVSGKGLAGQNGSVTLRAPRTGSGSGNDVAIAAFDATGMKGSASTTVEAYKVYNVAGGSTITANPDSATNLQVADANGAPAGIMNSEANSFMGNVSAMLTRLVGSASGVAVRPGLEVRSTGDLTVQVNEDPGVAMDSRGWDLNAWHLPGTLTLRAADNLKINGSISDGFKYTANVSMPDWDLDPSRSASWNYRLVGGSDQSAANPLATIANGSGGNVKLSFARTTDASGTDNPVALVRTGTGSIEVAAGGNVLLDTLDLTTGTLLGNNFSSVYFGGNSSIAPDNLLGASLYTAGRVADTSPQVYGLQTGWTLASTPQNAANTAYGATSKTGASFAQDGGEISVYADGSVYGPVTRQLITNWLYRQGLATTDATGNTIWASVTSGRNRNGAAQYTAWWSRFDYFNEGIATLGGGDISIRANTGNVENVSASIPTNAYYTQTGGTATEYGGGDLTVSAGGDIRGGTFYVQKGIASLTAQGSIVAGDMKVNDLSGYGLPPIALRPVLAAGDAQFSVVAGKDLQVEGVINPMLVTESANNVWNGVIRVNGINVVNGITSSVFSTYSPNSAVSMTALSGNLLLVNNAYDFEGAATGGVTGNRFYLIYPSTVSAAALNGDISFQHGFSLWPSPTGELELLAKGSVTADFPKDSSGVLTGITQGIVMIDRDPASLLPAAAPFAPTVVDLNSIESNRVATGISYHTASGLHTGDADPVRVIALEGDVSFTSNTDSGHPATLVLPKAAEIIAGRDIVDAGFAIQQLATTDVTTVSAGRDIIDLTNPGVANNVSHIVTGPGRIDFTAGRNFDLGNSKGVITRGNLDNPYLPQEGSGINIVAGATPDYAAFAAQLSSPASLSVSEQAALITYMKTVSSTMPANPTVDDAWNAFNLLSSNVRRPFYDTLFFTALQQSSGTVGGGVLDLAKFDATIASLFPASSINGGDVNVFGSQLKTSRGGDINIFAPGGSVYAGLVAVPSYLKKDPYKFTLPANKDANNLSNYVMGPNMGIFTIAGGSIQALVKNDFLVNLGRVFTLGGGDITMVSQYGNIDAGKGSKTSQATPPPVMRTDEYGNTYVDISGSISGSGFATLQTSPDIPASNIYFITPRGTFDAGDAGVRSSGSISIVAQTVLNASNIVAAGNVSGAKTADTSGMAGAVTAPSSPPVTKTDGFSNTGGTDPNAASNLTVELISYGDAAAAIPDKGQQAVTQGSQTPIPAETDDQRKKKKLL